MTALNDEGNLISAPPSGALDELKQVREKHGDNFHSVITISFGKGTDAQAVPDATKAQADSTASTETPPPLAK